MRQTDASIMALQFFAPIFLLLNQYDGIPEKEAEDVYKRQKAACTES